MAYILPNSREERTSGFSTHTKEILLATRQSLSPSHQILGFGILSLCASTLDTAVLTQTGGGQTSGGVSVAGSGSQVSPEARLSRQC